MGTLYVARDPILDREVAIKVLRDADDEALRARFTREAKSAANLRHRNIVTIFDVGEHEGQPFIAMEYVHGPTFADLIREKVPLTLARKLALIEDLCTGLAYAHDSGIIHRDVKPANLMVDADDRLKILDFGIARVRAESGMTQIGHMVGSANYMSPEQVTNRPLDGRSDMFAVGAVFFELLSGRRAFEADSVAGVLHKVLSESPEDLRALCPNLAPGIVAIVERSLAKDPAARFADLHAMGAEIAKLRLALGDDSDAVVARSSGPGPAPKVPPPTVQLDATEQRARATVGAARRLFDDGRRADALLLLEEFRPASPLVSQAWLALSAEAAGLENSEADNDERQRSHSPPIDPTVLAPFPASPLGVHAEAASTPVPVPVPVAVAGDERKGTGGSSAGRRAKAPAAHNAPRQAPPLVQRNAKRRSYVLAGLLASLVFIVAVAAWLLQKDPTEAPASTVATTQVPAPSAETRVESPEPTQQSPVPPSPAAPVDTAPTESAPVEDSVPPTSPAERQLALVRARLDDRLAADDYRQALALILQGLTLRPDDPALIAAADRVADAARRDAMAARDALTKAAAVNQSLRIDGNATFAEAEQFRRRGLRERTIRGFWRATELFTAAAAAPTPVVPRQVAVAEEPAAPRVAVPSPPVSTDRIETEVTATPRPPLLPPPPVAAPPPRTASAAPAPTADTGAPAVDRETVPRRPTASNDESAIQATLNRYAQAYGSLSVPAVIQVFPSVDRNGLERAFKDLEAQDVQIMGSRVTLDGTRATVVARVRQTFRSKVGTRDSTEREVEFRLEKSGDTWLIVSRR
jgi:serine/threonine-protein kinase